MNSTASNGDQEPTGIPYAVQRAAADSLAVKLAEFAGSLSQRDARLLAAIVVRSMNPLERMRYLDASGLLTAEELRLLGGLPPAQG